MVLRYHVNGVELTESYVDLEIGSNAYITIDGYVNGVHRMHHEELPVVIHAGVNVVNIRLSKTQDEVPFSIAWELNGGEMTENGRTNYFVNDNYVLPLCTKDGYEFLGWYTDSSFAEGTRVTSIAPNTTGNLTFYAKWGDIPMQEPEENIPPEEPVPEPIVKMVPVRGEYNFQIGKYEVTRGQWLEVMGLYPEEMDEVHIGVEPENISDDHPVTFVSWLDALKFCNKLSERENKMPYYNIDENNSMVEISINESADGYRLPTLEEWEYAARAGDASGVYGYGNGGIEITESNLAEYAHYGAGWHADRPVYTFAVGEKNPNAYGIHDMLGNVWEFCYGGQAEIDKNSDTENIKRCGGSVCNSTNDLKIPSATTAIAVDGYSDIGFRIACN